MAGLSTSTSVFAVVGLGVLGVAGFNTIRNGCPTCFVAKAPEATLASHGTHEAGDEACPLGCEGEGAKVVTVAAASGEAGDSCCAGETKAAKDECCASGEAAAAKADGCCAGGEAETVAEEAPAAGGA